MPGLSKAHEVHCVRSHRKCSAIGDDGDEICGVRGRSTKEFAAGIDCDDVRVPGDECSRGDPGSGADVEHSDPGERPKHVEHLIRI